MRGLIKNEEGLYRTLLSLLREPTCGHPVTSPVQSNRIDGSTLVDWMKSACRDFLGVLSYSLATWLPVRRIDVLKDGSSQPDSNSIEIVMLVRLL